MSDATNCYFRSGYTLPPNVPNDNPSICVKQLLIVYGTESVDNKGSPKVYVFKGTSTNQMLF